MGCLRKKDGATTTDYNLKIPRTFLSDSFGVWKLAAELGHAGIVHTQMLLLVSGTFCVRPSPVTQLVKSLPAIWRPPLMQETRV